MKKLLLLLSLFLLSCSKEEILRDEIVETPIEIGFCTVDPLPTVDFSKESYFTFDISHPSVDYFIVDGYNYGSSYISTDYNNDGFLDLVGFEIDFSDFRDRENSYTGFERKNLIKFYQGDCNGNLTEDLVNSNKFLGLVHGRKILLGDFNNETYVDFFFIGHGYDRAPFPGEFNKVLLSSLSGKYEERDFTELTSFYHGGGSGDIDNDGDLDVIAVDAGRGKTVVYLNNNGEFTSNISIIDQSLFGEMFTADLVDIDNDGFLDIITGGHDWSYGSPVYNNPPKIIYGDGVNFLGNRVQTLPTSSIDGQGVITNFEVYDINGDSNNEIIIVRTGDGKDSTDNFYRGWSIQVLELEGGKYVDKTSEFIDIFSGSSRWITWTKIKDINKNGLVDLITSGTTDSGNYIRWELSNGKFIKK